jgi:hypothetical protein
VAATFAAVVLLIGTGGIDADRWPLVLSCSISVLLLSWLTVRGVGPR